MKPLKIAFDDPILGHKFIVFCVDHYNPLDCIRSLGEVGIKPIVILVGATPKYLHKSRYIGLLHKVSSKEDGLSLLLKYYGEENSKPFIFTCSDDIESLLDENYELLKNKFYFFDGSEQGRITRYMDKEEINQAAALCGLRIPRAEVLKKGEYPSPAIPFPVITKSIMSIVGGWKDDVFICHDKEELKNAYEEIKSSTLLVEEYIEKSNELCLDGISINGGEEIYIPLKCNYIRFNDKSYGNYMDMSLFEDIDLLSHIKELIKITKFTGIFSIEFLVTKNNELIFLEVNFRNSTWSYASTFAGANLPVIWARSVFNGKLDLTGVELRKESFTAMAEWSDFGDSVLRGNLSLWQWLKDFHNCPCTYIYNSADKMPFFSFVGTILSRNFKRLLHLKK